MAPGQGLSVWSWHIHSVSAWVSSGHFSFFLQSKDTQVRLTAETRLPQGMSV
uniref:Uncharacterized protein n=1 Tax=Anguilla anguilla TaxID=7936 RepID=A0A0E9RIZ0_ANGAN